MPIHKLATGPITMVVAKAEMAPSSFDPNAMQVKFVSTADDVVYVSEKAATMQLGRLNLTVDTSVGQTLTFEQVKKDGRTYTNINLAAAGAPVGAAAPAAAVAPSKGVSMGAMTLDQAVPLYAECVEAAIATLGKACVSAGIMVESAAIQAAAATLFIRVSK